VPQATAGDMFTNECFTGSHAGSQAVIVELLLLLLFKYIFARKANAGQGKWLQL